MPPTKLDMCCPPLVMEHMHPGKMHDAVTTLAQLAGADLTVRYAHDAEIEANNPDENCHRAAIQYRDKPQGWVQYSDEEPLDQMPKLAGAMASLTEHLLEREMAVGSLAEGLMTSYEELDLFYTLFPTVSSKTDAHEIAEVLVEETAKTLHCKRVSIMILDEKKKCYHVLASKGLPDGFHNIEIPIANSMAEHAMSQDNVLVVNNVNDHPELAGKSQGQYESNAFALVRVPLKAQGQALGLLSVTERIGDPEFTARDRKLLEGFSAMGASALLNCHLHKSINMQMMSTIHALASAVDAKDKYTHDHAGRVASLCVATARELGITEQPRLREIELSGLLHDIGKIGIPDAILSKPEQLTPEEYKTIQAHTHIGAKIVQHVPGLENVAKAIHHHHERFDGLGYPDNLAGEAIPLASAIISVADTYDALTSDRPYRKAGSNEDAVAELTRCKGTQFDPNVVDALVKIAYSETNEPAKCPVTLMSVNG